MINSKILQLDMLLDYFLQQSSDPEKSNHSARQLALYSEREGFIDSAFQLLLVKQLSWNKTKLLSIMIKDSFKFCFDVLNAQKMDDYYNVLCDLAKKKGVNNKTFYLNIAESLSIIYINAVGMSTEDYPLVDFLRPMESKDDPELFHYYFKIMEYCASEVESSSLVLQQNYRQNAKKIIIRQQTFILRILQQKAQQVWNNNRYDKEVLISCFQYWIQIHFNQEVMQMLPTMSIFQGVVETLNSNTIADDAVSCLKSIVYRLNEQDQNIYGFMLDLMCRILLLASQELKSGADLAEMLIELVVNFGIKYANVFVKNYNNDLHQHFLLPLLKFFSTGIEKIIENLIDFAKNLITSALQAKSKGLLQPQLKVVAVVILLHLFQVIQYPPNFIQKMNQVYEHKLCNYYSRAEVIFRSRQDSVALFQQISELIGVKKFLSKVIEVISQLDFEEPNFHGKLEAYLFSLVNPLKELDEIDDNTRFLVNTYEEVVLERESPICIQRTFLRLFRPLFSVPNRESQLVMKLFNYTSTCFQNPSLFQTAERTYYRGCEDNPKLMSPYLPGLFNIVEAYPHEEYIVRGFIQVACSDPTLAYLQVDNCLNFVLKKTTDLHVSLTRTKEYLHTLTAIIRELIPFEFQEKIEIVKGFTRNAWTLIIGTLKQPKSKNDDEDILIQKVVKLIKVIMRLLKTDFLEFLPSLFDTVNSAFQKYPICSYVYLVEIAVTVFHNSPGGPEYLSKLYENFSTLAFNHLRTPQNLEKYGYLVDDFLGMSGRLIFFNAQIIISSHQFPRLLQFIAGDCLLTNSPKVSKAAYKFLDDLFMIFWNDELKQDYNIEENEFAAPVVNNNELPPYIRVFLLAQMKNIVSHMLDHLSEIPSETTKERIIDALLSEVKAFPEQNVDIWKDPLLKIQPDVLVSQQKQKILLKFEYIRQLNRQGYSLNDTINLIYKDLELIYDRMAASQRRKRFKINFK